MDPISQAALGGAVGYAVFHRSLGLRAMAVGAVAGMVPDLDSLYGALEGPFGRLVSHRGITHSLWFGPVVGAVLGWATHKYLLARDGPGSRHLGTRGAWMGLFALALLSHPLLDVFTSYGTQLLAPFSRARFSLDGIAVVDPLYTFTLIFGLIGGGLLRGRPRAGQPAAFALVVTTLYLFAGVGINAWAEAEGRRQLVAQGIVPDSVEAYPTMLQLPHRRVVATHGDSVRVGFISAWSPCAIDWGTAMQYTDGNIERLLRTEEGGIFAWFTGDRLLNRTYEDGANVVVELIDLRYGYTPDPYDGLWIVRAIFNRAGHLVSPPRRYQNRPPVNGETVGELFDDAFGSGCRR